MLAAAAEAPAGNHHVFARKKYVLTKVISQITISRTRPIARDLQSGFLSLPHEGNAPIPKNKKWGTQTGASLSQLFPGASGFLHFFFSCFQSRLMNPSIFFTSSQTRIDEKIC